MINFHNFSALRLIHKGKVMSDLKTLTFYYNNGNEFIIYLSYALYGGMKTKKVKSKATLPLTTAPLISTQT